MEINYLFKKAYYRFSCTRLRISWKFNKRKSKHIFGKCQQIKLKHSACPLATLTNSANNKMLTLIKMSFKWNITGSARQDWKMRLYYGQQQHKKGRNKQGQRGEGAWRAGREGGGRVWTDPRKTQGNWRGNLWVGRRKNPTQSRQHSTQLWQQWAMGLKWHPHPLHTHTHTYFVAPLG